MRGYEGAQSVNHIVPLCLWVVVVLLVVLVRVLVVVVFAQKKRAAVLRMPHNVILTPWPLLLIQKYPMCVGLDIPLQLAVVEKEELQQLIKN